MNLKIEAVDGAVPAIGARAVANATRDKIEAALAENANGIKVDAGEWASELRASGQPEFATTSGNEVAKALRAILTRFARIHEKRATMRRVSGNIWYLAAL